MYGQICRNRLGRLGIVIGFEWDHSKGVPCRWWGIGLRGGKWESIERPKFVALNIEDYAKRRKEIQRDYQQTGD